MQEQLSAIIQNIKIILRAIKEGRAGKEAILDVQMSVGEVNRILYHVSQLKFQKDYDLNLVESDLDYLPNAHKAIYTFRFHLPSVPHAEQSGKSHCSCNLFYFLRKYNDTAGRNILSAILLEEP